ncbi:hypothetical protein [Streptomyces thermolilacinus]|uniref:hypothetical protein n=1 Tax=Streptomyces thermolilacinus TaxID=285540 RepID=UPI0033CCD378
MTLFVGRIPSCISTGQLEEHFRKFGRVENINHKDSYAFIEFESESSEEGALKTGTHLVDGAAIRVERASG